MNGNGKRSWRFIPALVILFISSSMALQAGAPVRNQRTSQGYDTIKEAIAESRPGDTILVSPARYEENLIIRHALTIQGEKENGEMPLLVADPGFSVITVLNPPRGSEVIIDSLAMEVSITDSYAILMDVAHFTLTNSKLSGNGSGTGLLTFLPSSVTIENNYFSNLNRALSIGGTEEEPVVIRGNTFESVKESIVVYDIPGSVIESNIMTFNPPPREFVNSVAISISGSPNSQILGNAICWHGFGIFVVTSHNSLVQSNIIEEVSAGITGGGSRNTVINSNRIEGGEYAMTFYSTVNAQVRQNWMADSQYGMHNSNQYEPEYIIDAIDNWWGASDGPSFEGSGSGVPVNLNVLFEPWLKSRPDIDNKLKCR